MRGEWGPLGIETQIPVNRVRRHVGVLLQAHSYLDDIFPNSLGKPLSQVFATGGRNARSPAKASHLTTQREKCKV
jgi:hypothetical protein